MIYNNGSFGRISWSKDAQKITFIAEKQKINEYVPYWKLENDDPNSSIPFWYDKYKYNHKNSNIGSGFGEGIGGLIHPVIVIYDIVNKSCKIIDIIELEQNQKLDSQSILTGF